MENRLKDARGRRGRSRNDVATAASISVETYRYLESAAEDRARVNPTLDNLLRVAFVLGLDDLIRVDD